MQNKTAQGKLYNRISFFPTAPMHMACRPVETFHVNMKPTLNPLSAYIWCIASRASRVCAIDHLDLKTSDVSVLCKTSMWAMLSFSKWRSFITSPRMHVCTHIRRIRQTNNRRRRYRPPHESILNNMRVIEIDHPHLAASWDRVAKATNWVLNVKMTRSSSHRLYYWLKYVILFCNWHWPNRIVSNLRSNASSFSALI
jgi:hypothetical protein